MKVAFEASSGRIPPPSLLQEQQREQRSRGVRHPSHGRTLQRRRYAHQYMLACYCILAVAFLKSDYSRCRSSVGSGARRNHSVWVEAAGVATTTRQSTESDDESTPNKRRDREKDTQQARSKQENSKSSSSSSSSSSRQEQNHNDQSGNRNGDKSDDDNDSPNGSFELNATKALSMLFPMDQPRHIVEGLWDMAKSVTTALGLSATALFTMIVEGMQSNGLAGMVTGGITGTAYALVIFMTGLVNGANQVARGVWHTPLAIQAALPQEQGIVWNPARGRYQVYSLEEEWKELHEDEEYTTLGSSALPKRKVKDPAYYNLLGVPTHASSRAIQRAYRKKARLYHPDKNPGNIQAAQTFQQLHKIYQVLSDEEQRELYDTWGPPKPKNSTDSDIPQFDPYIFYTILLSSQLVEPYTGDLTIASFTANVFQLLASEMKREDYFKVVWPPSHDKRARKRQVEIALFLKQRVGPYMQGVESPTEFRTKCRHEAEQIADTTFGRDYLLAIGTALIMESRRYLVGQPQPESKNKMTGWVNRAAVVVQNKMASVKSLVTIAGETMDVFRLIASEMSVHGKNAQSAEEETEESLQRQQEEFVEKFLPELLDVAWAYNTRDIHTTLHGACRRLCTDAPTRAERWLRAEAMQILGEEFVQMAEAMGRSEATQQHDKAHDASTGDTKTPPLSSKKETRTRVATQHLLARVNIAYLVSSVQGGGLGPQDDLESLIRHHEKGQSNS